MSLFHLISRSLVQIELIYWLAGCWVTDWCLFVLFVCLFVSQVLQKLGKADETRDVVFEEMVAKFNKQMVSRYFMMDCFKGTSWMSGAVMIWFSCFFCFWQTEGTKLHKDLKAYMAAVKSKPAFMISVFSSIPVASNDEKKRNVTIFSWCFEG